MAQGQTSTNPPPEPHVRTEIAFSASGEFSYSLHLLHLSALSPPTPASTQLAKILDTHLRTTITADVGLPLIAAFQRSKGREQIWVPFTDAEAKFICMHMDAGLYLRDHPLNHSAIASEKIANDVGLMTVGTKLRDTWGDAFYDAMEENVRSFGKTVTTALATHAIQHKLEISASPQILRTFLQGSVAKDVGSPLSKRLNVLLTSSDPKLQDRHLLYLVQLLELVAPTGILGDSVPRPTSETTQDFYLMFGNEAMEFLKTYVKEDYARMKAKREAAEMQIPEMQKAREKKVIVAKRLVKKVNVKLEKAVKRKEADDTLDITAYEREMQEARDAVVRAEKELGSTEEWKSAVARAEEELRMVEELERERKGWYCEMEEQIIQLAKDVEEKEKSQEKISKDE